MRSELVLFDEWFFRDPSVAGSICDLILSVWVCTNIASLSCSPVTISLTPVILVALTVFVMVCVLVIESTELLDTTLMVSIVASMSAIY